MAWSRGYVGKSKKFVEILGVPEYSPKLFRTHYGCTCSGPRRIKEHRIKPKYSGARQQLWYPAVLLHSVCSLMCPHLRSNAGAIHDLLSADHV